MKPRLYIPLLLTVAVLPACAGDSPVGPACTPITIQQASMSGDTITTTTGLQYIETQLGTGAVVEACRAIVVHYTLFVDGERLESSRDTNQPVRFTPGSGQLIAGFEQGVIGMRIDGQRRLIIPPSLGYGNTAGHPLSASTLVFDVEL
jgi:FKBP-type peptidyl-prolyl cis-trans isomerase